MTIKTITLIGAGSVATNLAYALRDIVHIAQIYSRNPMNAESLAEKAGLTGTRTTGSLKEISPDSDLYIVSVPDNIYKVIYEEMPHVNGIIVNTSGTLPVPFHESGRERCGVFYPMQTFKKDKIVSFRNIPILIQGSDSSTENALKSLAEKITDKSLVVKDSATKAKIHLAAVFASNFPNYLWGISDKVLRECGADLNFVGELIKETFTNALSMGPDLSQTGPAMRGDTDVIEKQMSLIRSIPLPHPSTEEIYATLSSAILQKYHPNEQD